MKIAAFALFAVAISSVPAVALDAMRCNVQTRPGLYEPVLRIVTQGRARDIRLGSEGLTRKIFYRDRYVLAYLAQIMDVAPRDLPARVSRVCGAVEEEIARAAPAVAAPAAPAAPPAASETEVEAEGPTDAPVY